MISTIQEIQAFPYEKGSLIISRSFPFGQGGAAFARTPSLPPPDCLPRQERIVAIAGERYRDKLERPAGTVKSGHVNTVHIRTYVMIRAARLWRLNLQRLNEVTREIRVQFMLSRYPVTRNSRTVSSGRHYNRDHDDRNNRELILNTVMRPSEQSLVPYHDMPARTSGRARRTFHRNPMDHNALSMVLAASLSFRDVVAKFTLSLRLQVDGTDGQIQKAHGGQRSLRDQKRAYPVHRLQERNSPLLPLPSEF